MLDGIDRVLVLAPHTDDGELGCGALIARLAVYPNIVRSPAFACTGAKTELALSLARSVDASVYLSGQGGANYQDEHESGRAGIQLRYSEFVHPVCQQRQLPFVAGLSILDMLFTCGPTAVREALYAGSNTARTVHPVGLAPQLD